MEAAVVLLFAVLAGAVFVSVRYGRFTAQRRLADLRGFVHSHGWRLGSGDEELTRRWPGPPFHPGGGVARPVVTGTHRGRDFLAFEYLYEVTPSPAAKTAIPHRRTVVTIPLPAPVPDLAVTRKDAVAGAVARVLDRPGADVPGESGRRYHVACTDQLFATTVLQPPVLAELEAGPAWEWRFAGDTMVGYQAGRLTPDRLLSGLDALADVLDRIPAEAWRHGGPAAA
ncbi:hypothetical protein E1262_05900 [Jiangella aurantiaca]|uniref:DUF3137 domain-containing protein n=1 Tax=Jiangella aurantiaca TaxID=2530373 RepID=A0A4R5AJK8_9ACTN|nr:hypothetical protein [Jiangella aurantiaca]TDD71666.1 hypothetical protein E1262_05900 [Jiangella aurantiaca]